MDDNSSNSSAPASPQRKENIKETIESILVAFILAFVFRAFVVEAFVIPSGSMAPTLLGAHMRYRCQECGYQFDVNFPTDSRDENLVIPSLAGPRTVFSSHCPNCGYKVPSSSPDPYQSATNSPVNYGDRILVLKYLYLIQEPQRWDVVVFKSPSERTKYEVNFIKRLVGKAGEAIMLLDGDVYAAPSFTGPVDAQPWKVQTKPRAAQNALWRIVYDNDFYPRNSQERPSPWQSPWQKSKGQGWEADGQNGPGRILRFNNAASFGTLRFDKDTNKGEFPFTDWLPYNETMTVPRPEGNFYNTDSYAEGRIPRWYVSDLKLQFSYQRTAGDGELRASLSKLRHDFIAVLSPGSAKLLHRLPDGQLKTVAEAKLDFAGAGPLMVELANVDYQVTLRVNGRNLIQTTPEQYSPNVAELLSLHRERERLIDRRAGDEAIRSVFGVPRVELSAERQSCEISHLSLWRDVYYTPHYYEGGSYGALEHGSPERPIKLHLRAKDVENEYFVLGDNSVLSGDARRWIESVDLPAEELRTQSGCVPERFLLGKAFFVYWPAGYRPYAPTVPGIIPNFGELRFIR
jgi:signal peptidase I